MDMKEICPCPNLNCPNHGDCEKCTSRHVRLGYLNYCAFQTILPTFKQMIHDAPESPMAKKLDDLLGLQLAAYEKLMNEHDLLRENQDKLLKMVAAYSDY